MEKSSEIQIRKRDEERQVLERKNKDMQVV